MTPIELLHAYRRFILPFRQHLDQQGVVRDWLSMNSRGANKGAAYIYGMGRPQDILAKCERDMSMMRADISILNEDLLFALREAQIELDIEPLRVLQQPNLTMQKLETADKFLREVETKFEEPPQAEAATPWAGSY